MKGCHMFFGALLLALGMGTDIERNMSPSCVTSNSIRKSEDDQESGGVREKGDGVGMEASEARSRFGGRSRHME